MRPVIDVQQRVSVFFPSFRSLRVSVSRGPVKRGICRQDKALETEFATISSWALNLREQVRWGLPVMPMATVAREPPCCWNPLKSCSADRGAVTSMARK